MSSRVGRSSLGKSISRFLPVTTHPVEESERHYVEVHFPWAQRLLRAQPQVQTYHVNRAVRQYDQLGRFRRRPSAWRFVLLTFDEGRNLQFDVRTSNAIAQDHPNCLRDLRGTPVEESVVRSRLDGQTALAKYLIEVDRTTATPQADAVRGFESFTDALAERLDAVADFRLLRLNRVLAEAATAPVVEPGQRTTGEMLPETTKTGYVEVYFDDAYAGDDFFARRDVLELFDDARFATMAAYHVEERCGLDRR